MKQHYKQYISALLLQPAKRCTRNCNNCYLQLFNGNDTQGFRLHHDLLSKIYSLDPPIVTRQLTIGLNPLPRTGLYRRRAISFFIRTARIVARRSNKDPPELHLTFSDLGSCYDYFMGADRFHRKEDVKALSEFKRNITLVSISNLDIRRYKISRMHWLKKRINWNWMPRRGEKIDLQEVMRTLELVKSCYLIFEKRPLGMEQDVRQLAAFIRLYVLLKEKLPYELFKKIHLDRCIEAAIQYSKTGYGCSSNVSVFHVWPNGYPTGCPYNVIGLHRYTFSMGKTIKEIARRRGIYEFDDCKIPKAYNVARELIMDGDVHVKKS